MSAPELVEADRPDAPPETETAPRTTRWSWWPAALDPWLVAALAVVVVANAPYLIGAFDPNPLLAQSGLSQGGSSILPGQTSIDPNAGFTSQADGHRAALDWLRLRIPWWNPWEGFGVPLAGSPSAAAFFLPFVLLTIIPDGQVGIYLALDLIGCAATWGVLRRLAVARPAAFAGAVLFGLCGMSAWFRYVADNPVAFLPVMVLGVEMLRSAAVDRRRGGWALLAIGTTFSVLASFPETALLDGLIVVVWLLVRAATAGREVAVAMIRRAVLGAVVGLLIAMPFVVAFAAYYPNGYLGGHTNGGFGTAALVPEGVVTTVAPYALGPIFGFGAGSSTDLLAMWSNVGGYLTAALVALAAYGLFGARLRALRLALGASAAVLLARNFGFWPAVHLVLLIPTASNDAIYRYDDAAIEFAVIALAALGIDDLVRRRSRAWWPALVGVGVLALTAFAWHEARPLYHLMTGPHVRAWWLLSLGWAAATAVVITGCLVVGRRAAAAIAVALLVVEGVLMFAVPEASSPRGATMDRAAVSFLRAHVGTGRFATFGPFQPDYGAYYGVASVNINDLPVPKATKAYDTTQLAPNGLPISFDGVNPADPTKPSPLAELPGHLQGYRRAGVDYLLVDHGTPLPALPAGAVTTVYQDPVVDIYRLNGADPYFTASPGCRVHFTSTTVVTTTCARPGTVLRRETMLPGWTATTRGRQVAPTAAGPFQQVPVPAGRATTTFAFTPPHEGLAWLCCLAGVVLLVTLTGAGTWLRGRRWSCIPGFRRRPAPAYRPRHAR